MDVFTFSNAHGERIGFAYEVQNGSDAGAVLVQSAASSESPTSKLADILRTLLGREPSLVEMQGAVDHRQIGPLQISVRTENNRGGKQYSMVASVTR